MRKLTTTVTLLLVLTGAAQAQSNVSLGLKGGASYTSFGGDNSLDASYTWGFHAGAFANVGLSSLLAFQPEIIYSQKGGSFSTLLLDHIKRRLSYVDIPLLLRVNADGLFFEAGPQLGFLMNGKDISLIYKDADRDIRSSLNKFDFGYAVGVGYQTKFGPGVGVRYNGGISDVYKPFNSIPITSKPENYNSAFQFYLTYSFGSK